MRLPRVGETVEIAVWLEESPMDSQEAETANTDTRIILQYPKISMIDEEEQYLAVEPVGARRDHPVQEARHPRP